MGDGVPCYGALEIVGLLLLLLVVVCTWSSNDVGGFVNAVGPTSFFQQLTSLCYVESFLFR